MPHGKLPSKKLPETVVAIDPRSDRISQTRRRSLMRKFCVASFNRFAAISDLEAIITDSGLPAAEGHRYAALGPKGRGQFVKRQPGRPLVA